MTLLFRVMRPPYRRFSHTGPFRKNPAASNGGPQPRAQRSGSRLEAKKFPVRYWAPPQGGDSCQAGAAERRKQGKMGKGPVWPPCGRPPTASPAKRVAVGSEEIPCPAKKPRRQAGIRAKQGISELEQVKGIEPSCSAWEADVLPLNYTCNLLTGIL